MRNLNSNKGLLSVENMAKAIIIIVIVLIVLSIVGQFIAAYFIVNNPDSIGNWIGEYFSSVKSNIGN